MGIDGHLDMVRITYYSCMITMEMSCYFSSNLETFLPADTKWYQIRKVSFTTYCSTKLVVAIVMCQSYGYVDFACASEEPGECDRFDLSIDGAYSFDLAYY